MQHFLKIGNTGGIIQEDNSSGHCFVLRDLGSIKKPYSSLADFGCKGGGGLSESVEKGNFMTKNFFQIIMLNEVIKACQK